MRRPFALLLALVACTGASPPEMGSPTPERFTFGAARPPIRVPVIVTLSGREVGEDDTYLDGMELARREVNRAGGVAGRALELELIEDEVGGLDATVRRLREALAAEPPAIFVLSAAEAVRTLRTEIEAAEVPVILVGGDLYTSRSMFRWVFQTAVPWRWQARVIARYLVVDRKHERVVLVTRPGPDEQTVRETFVAAMAQEGGSVAEMLTASPGEPRRGQLDEYDAAVLVGDTDLVEDTLDQFLGREEHPQFALSSDSVLWPTVAGTRIPWGTVTPYAYTWSTWAKPIPRVQTFRESFRAVWGVQPEGHQQEGYDAVRALEEALELSGGEGGDALIRGLEGFRKQTYSSVPVRLGPDDHVLAEESHLGLFAMMGPPAPKDDLRGEALGPTPWRPIMRTFTTDGEKVNLLDRDKRILFPFWRPKRPTPKYWRSEYGIATRPSDPLH